MKRNYNDDKKVRDALETCLPRIDALPSMHDEIMKKIRGEGKVKKKFSVGLVLAIVLILITVTALATVFSDLFFNTAGSLQESKGNMSTWSLADKLELIESMQESGVELPIQKYEALLAPAISEEEADRIANEILVQSKFAREALESKYGFTHNTFDYFTREVAFSQSIAASDQSMWIVSYQPLEYAEQIGSYEVRLSGMTGEVLDASWSFDAADESDLLPDHWGAKVWSAALIDRIETFDEAIEQKKEEMEKTLGIYAEWSIEDKAALDEVYIDQCYPIGDFVINILPSEEDVSYQDALRFAKDSLMEKYAVEEAVLDGCRLEQSFFLMPAPEEKQWIFMFHVNDWGEIYIVEFSSPSKDVLLCKYYEGQAKREEAKTIEPSPIPDAHAQAIDAAWEVMKSQYGFADEARIYFKSSVATQKETTTITFRSNKVNQAIIGAYRIELSSTDNALEEASWEHEEAYAKQSASNPWSEAKLWGAYECNQYAVLQMASNAIMEEADCDYNDLSMEEKAAHDLFFREAGYDRMVYYHGIPGAMDITLEEAIEIAKNTAKNQYQATDSQLENATIFYEFNVFDATRYLWDISVSIEEIDTMYTVRIDSMTGGVVETRDQPASNG